MSDVTTSLRVLRTQLGVTQKQFAKLIGIPPSTYQKKETGESPINLEEIYRITQVANKTVEEIFFTN